MRILRNALAVSLILGAVPALAADYGAGAESYGFHGLPPCDDAAVVATIPEKFAYQDANIVGSGLTITNIDRIRENRLVAGGPGFIDRRYCTGTAYLSNGRRSEVVYLIEGPKMGFASIGWHVESCLPGYDPYRVYDARCRSVRP